MQNEIKQELEIFQSELQHGQKVDTILQSVCGTLLKLYSRLGISRGRGKEERRKEPQLLGNTVFKRHLHLTLIQFVLVLLLRTCLGLQIPLKNGMEF